MAAFAENDYMEAAVSAITAAANKKAVAKTAKAIEEAATVVTAASSANARAAAVAVAATAVVIEMEAAILVVIRLPWRCQKLYRNEGGYNKRGLWRQRSRHRY